MVARQAPLAMITLPLPYPVYGGAGVRHAIDSIAQQVAASHRVAVISDTTVAPLHAEQVAAHFPAATTRLFTIPPGEQQKTRAQWGELTDALLAWGAGRDTTIVAVGGGVIGDLAGFVAATYMRGVPLIQVPTTLLAMVDASIGGKTAVDTPFGKNLVGAWYHPAAVVIDPELLLTLPDAVVRHGFAEMIKHGVIADATYFQGVLHFADTVRGARAAVPESVHALHALITGSMRIKAAVVAEDQHEGGRRHILNFGHTIAHAVEQVLNYTLPHGEAVAAGMVAEARLAEMLALAPAGLAATIADAVERAGLPSRIPTGVSLDAILAATHGDKKSRQGTVRYALPQGLGTMHEADGRYAVGVTDAVVRQALESL